MKAGKKPSRVGEMRPSYDFSAGTRGKYAARYAQGARVVLLDPDVADMFPDTASVNRALRMLMDLARRSDRVEQD